MNITNSKWSCQKCGQLLGVVNGDRLNIRFARGHQYRVALPVICICRNPRCKTLNELRAPPPLRSASPLRG